MNIHITKTYNIGGLIGLRQNSVRNAAEKMGYKEMSLFRFPDIYDTDDDLNVRMEGITSALCPSDIVIFQHPSGGSPRYDTFLYEHIKACNGTKIVAFVQEVASRRTNIEYSLQEEIDLLNRADMYIFASELLRKYYLENGLMEKPYIIQKVSDYLTDISVNRHNGKKLYLMLDADGESNPNSYDDVEVITYDEYHAAEIILKLSEGGMGLICNQDETALGIYMAAGIPVIIKKGLPGEEYVTSHKIGLAASDLNDIYRNLMSLTEDSMRAYYDNVKKLQGLFTSGMYTQKLLIDTVLMVKEML